MPATALVGKDSRPGTSDWPAPCVYTSIPVSGINSAAGLCRGSGSSRTSNCCWTTSPMCSSPGMWPNNFPGSSFSEISRMRPAPALAETIVPSGCITSTPEVRLSRMVCNSDRDASSSAMLLVAACRASASCCVICANDRVNPPSSSRASWMCLGRKSPSATCRTPSASSNSGRASCAASSAASNTAPNTARNKVRVNVPMNMRCMPVRANARSWYSRLAACTNTAFCSSSCGTGCNSCKTHASPCSPNCAERTSA